MSYIKFTTPFYFIFLGTLLSITNNTPLPLIEKIVFTGVFFIFGSPLITLFFYKNKANIEAYSKKPDSNIILEIIFGKSKKGKETDA